MNIRFEFLNIHMNEKTTICNDFHGFKSKKHKCLCNVNYFSLLFGTLFGSLDCDYTHHVTFICKLFYLRTKITIAFALPI
jgi:hypothetical protein